MAQRLALTGLTLALMVQATFTRTSFVRLRDAGGLRLTAAYDVDRERALLEGPFHRVPVQQLSLTSHINDPAPCLILASCSALSRLYKDYATITWTVNGRLLKNLIDRSALSTVRNDGPVKVSKIAINQLDTLPSDNGKFVTKATIALGSIFEDTCMSNSQCELSRALCNEDCYLTSHPSPGRRPRLALRLLRAMRLHPAERRLHGPSDRRLCSRVCPLAGLQDLRQATDHRRKRIGQPCKANSECHTAGAACLKDVCACASHRYT
ncbi:hypothetical protein HPB49_012800 [Dermacentor silvarum]|uniref:Uncharacterized protein n=1 Tax=Dermacentor silvarum TaxID=543639 RepID=A0ACB8D5M5_DERSI|nr:hypothetical protein HPB49_012800 [Dermacentor silvarum]